MGYNEEITDIKYIPLPPTVEGETPPERHFAVATNSNQIRLFGMERMDCRLLFGHSDLVLSLDVSADGAWLGSVRPFHHNPICFQRPYPNFQPKPYLTLP